MDENTNKGTSNVRGGRGTTGEPAEIRDSIAEARKVAVRIDHDLAKLKNDKDALLFTIANLRVKEKQSVDKGVSSETEAIRKEITKAQEKMDKMNGVIKEASTPEDHRKIQKIVSEWYGGKRDWSTKKAHFQKAEKILESNPGDRRAQGDANRARTEMQAVKEELDNIAKQAEGVLKNSSESKTAGEGIFFTHEQAMQEREAIEERRSKHQPETAPAPAELVVQEEIPRFEPEEEVEEVATLEPEIVAVIEEAIEKETPEVFHYETASAPEVKFLPDPEKDDALLPLVTEYAKAPVDTPRLNRKAVSDFIKKILSFISSLVPKPKIRPKETAVVATQDVPVYIEEKEEPVQEIQEVAEELAPETAVIPDEFLEKQLFTEFEAPEQASFSPSVEQTTVPVTPEPVEVPVETPAEPEEAVVPEEVEGEQTEPQEVPPQQEEVVVAEMETPSPVEEYVPPMPQEIVPGNTTELEQIEAQADAVFHNDMNDIFRIKKGPWGILGSTNGLDSIDWKNTEVGFGSRTVGDVMRATPTPPVAGGEPSFGVENAEKVEKMKKYLSNVSQVSGLDLDANEESTIADFIRRGALAKLSK